MKVDFSGVPDRDDGDFAPLPDGRYTVRVERVDEREVQNGSNAVAKMFALGMVVKGGQHDGRWVWDNLPIIDSCLWRLKQVLVAVGVDCSAAVDVTADLFEGRVVEIQTKQEKRRDGKVQARPARYLASDAETATAALDAELKEDDIPF